MPDQLNVFLFLVVQYPAQLSQYRNPKQQSPLATLSVTLMVRYQPAYQVHESCRSSRGYMLMSHCPRFDTVYSVVLPEAITNCNVHRSYQVLAMFVLVKVEENFCTNVL